MKKIVLALALSLGLSGCAGISAVGTGLGLATKSVSNPVTIQELYEIEASLKIIVTGLQSYKRACVANAVDAECKAHITAIQPYTRQIKPLLNQLRGFVRNNDQINAPVIYTQLIQLYANLKSAASNLGINVGG